MNQIVKIASLRFPDKSEVFLRYEGASERFCVPLAWLTNQLHAVGVDHH